MPENLREPLQITCSADPRGWLRASGLDVDERLGQPWRALVQAAQPATDPPLQADALIGSEAVIVLERTGDARRSWQGVITGCETEPAGRTWRRWQLTVEPPLAMHGIGRGSRLLRDRDAAGVAAELLGARCDLRDPPPQREQLVQWRESDLAWCQRLLEHEGIALVCDSSGILLTDHPAGFPRLDLALPWMPAGPGAATAIDPTRLPAVRAWRQRLAAAPRTATVRDWHWRSPQAAIARAAAVEGGSGPELREDGSHHRDGSEAARLAAIRAQEAACHSATWSGESDHPALAAGHVLRIAAPDEPAIEGSWLLTAVRHRATQAVETGGHGGGNTYACAFEAWPAGRPWRPARRTPVPRIPGLVHAVVDGAPAAIYADPDADGCYRVRPLFDAAGSASMAARLATPYAGDGHGMHLPLHAGTEVLLAHIDGDPDRPVIAAAVANPTHPAVVNDANASQCVLRTAGGNELMLEDALGREVWSTTAVRDRRSRVGGDDDTLVQGNRSAAVAGSETLAVQGDLAHSVGRASAETIAGAKALSVGAAMQVTVGGALNTSVGGAMAEQVGGTKSEAVAGARSSAVGGDASASVGGDQHESTAGRRQISARSLRLAAEDELTLTCGRAAIVLKRNGDVVIRGSAIRIDGSGAVTLRGSTVKAN